LKLAVVIEMILHLYCRSKIILVDLGEISLKNARKATFPLKSRANSLCIFHQKLSRVELEGNYYNKWWASLTRYGFAVKNVTVRTKNSTDAEIFTSFEVTTFIYFLNTV
jgi:hypothetical protein